MARVGRAIDVNDAAAPYDFAVLADLLDRRTNFHFLLPMPRRLAFFIRPSYWCDIKCDCVCAMKSITPTTMINSDVPPNWKGTAGFTMRMISGSKHTAMMYRPPHNVSRVNTLSRYSPVCRPGRIPGVNAPAFFKFSAVSRVSYTRAT